MSFAAERSVIRTKLSTLWGTTTAIAEDAFNGPRYERKRGVPFIRPRVEDGLSTWTAIGGTSARMRHVATLVVEVYRPVGERDAAGLANCDSLIDGFERYASGGVHFMQRGWARDVGTDGEWHKWLVFLPYYREEVT